MGVCGISSSSIVSFADDARLYHGISNVDDCSFFQNDLNSVYDWASCNNMSLDVAKKEVYTVVMTAQEYKLQEFTVDLQSESGRKNCFRVARQMAREGRDVINVGCIKK